MERDFNDQKDNKNDFGLDNRPFIKAVIDHFEDEHAVIQTADKQKLLWPRENLLPDTREGTSIKLYLSTDALETQDKEKMVKELLNQILKKSL